MAMKTRFIRQHIHTAIHDIMYQVSKQLVDIFKSMVQNEFQQVKNSEAV